MAPENALPTPHTDPFELKGSLFTLTVMRLVRTDLEAIERALAAKVAQAPGFFDRVPVVIDLEALAAHLVVDFNGLVTIVRAQGMVPVGVRHGSSGQQNAALAAGLALLPESRPAPKRNDAAGALAKRSRLVTTPVRSGQQLYAAEGDLVVTGTVSAGAELLADGHIHVYGALRGRALAGVKGDTTARIFCQSLEAELVSVAGHYRVIETTVPELRGKPVQVFLDGDKLCIEPLAR